MAPVPLDAHDPTLNADHRMRPTKNCTDVVVITEDFGKEMEASKIVDKIDFFRFMGLTIIKFRDMNYITNNDKNNNNNNNNNKNSNSKAHDVNATSKDPHVSSSIISDINNDDIPVKNFTCQSTSKCQYNKRGMNDISGDMVDSHKIIELMRECRVVIRGEKCRVCGKSFKCINDVQIHNKKKHRRKKPKRIKKVVLKIGNEVISRVPIKRKYLKRAAYQYDDRTIFNKNEISSWNEKNCSNDRINDQREKSFIELDDIYDIENDASTLAKITDRDLILSPLGDSRIHENEQSQNDDHEDIREVLRITRSRKLVSTINHETPNRMERELLLSDAIREFDRMENDPMDIIEFADNDEDLRDESNDIIEDYCWMADGTLRNSDLDLEENSCSFHIQNDYDINFSLEGVNSPSRGFDVNYFDDENNLLKFKKEYQKEKDDLPDFIDYAHSLEDNASPKNNDNKIYELESQFYNKAMISEWNKLTRVPKSINCDNRPHDDRNVNASVLIKEEIILDDLL